jgi:hypothetical protein
VISWVFELTPEGLKRKDEIAPAQSIKPQTVQRMDGMLLVVMALALGYSAFATIRALLGWLKALKHRKWIRGKPLTWRKCWPFEL